MKKFSTEAVPSLQYSFIPHFLFTWTQIHPFTHFSNRKLMEKIFPLKSAQKKKLQLLQVCKNIRDIDLQPFSDFIYTGKDFHNISN